jgi:hypothetical protein
MPLSTVSSAAVGAGTRWVPTPEQDVAAGESAGRQDRKGDCYRQRPS